MLYSSRIRHYLTCYVLDTPLELKLPVVDVLNPFSQLLGDVVLRAVGPGRAVAYQLLGLVANSEKKAKKTSSWINIYISQFLGGFNTGYCVKLQCCSAAYVYQ